MASLRLAGDSSPALTPHLKLSALFLSFSLVALILLATLVPACGSPAGSLLSPKPRLKVATTTSLYDTGLWSYLEPVFKKKYQVELYVIYAGTGIALEYGRRGDVDVVTIHDRASEEKFIADGYGVKRIPFACNYFIVVGPPSDPAGIKGLSAEDAFKKLFQTKSASFVSRGDGSGTHAREKAIWEKAGLDYEVVRHAGGWYLEAGRGMGPTLLMASEKQAYTLSDMATFLAYKGKLDLVPMADKGSVLLNVYSAIVVNPAKNPKTNISLANSLVDFLVSPVIQRLIGDYGVKDYGVSLFTPCAGAEPSQ